MEASVGREGELSGPLCSADVSGGCERCFGLLGQEAGRWAAQEVEIICSCVLHTFQAV